MTIGKEVLFMVRKLVPAGKFKAECLKMMDEVQRTKMHLIITKRNIPVVEMIPIEEKRRPGFGWMKGTAHVKGDIMKPIDEVWDASH
ncbi:MAG: prevent-host-death family protein [Chlamydiia bacterium]|nr:prevent-host-death family protein [Chlamydiia bacterium]